MAVTPAAVPVCFILLFGFLAAWASPLEDYLEGDTEAADRAAAVEELLAVPIDLNRASHRDLLSLPWLSRWGAVAILQERSRLGGFRDFSQVEEIQALSKEEIALLREVAFVGPAQTRPFQGSARVGASGSHEAAQPLRPTGLQGESRARFNSASGARGFVLSRHPQDSPTLSDVASAGFEFQWSQSRLLLGDYQAEFGTGLVLASSFGQAGWSRDALRTSPPEARGLRSSPTASPLGRLRGGAAETEWQSLRLSVFLSSLELPAVLENGHPSSIYRGSSSVGNLAAAREGQLREELCGVSLSASRGPVAFGLNGLQAAYRPGLSPSATPETPAPLEGNRLQVGSLCFSAAREGLVFLAEVAGSQPGGAAFQSAASLDAGPIGLASFVTYADADFHSPRSRVWDEFDAPAQNVRTVGTLLRAAVKNHLLTLRAASSATPFRTATSSLARVSTEVDARYRTFWRNIVLEARAERGRRESGGEDEPNRPVTITGGRLDVDIKSVLDLRLRTQVRRADSPAEAHDGVGSMSFVQVGQTRRVWSWLARLTLFHVTTNDAALTVYENNLRGSYPLVHLYGDGSRKMVMVARRWGPVRIGAKVARTDKTAHEERTWEWQFALQGEVYW